MKHLILLLLAVTVLSRVDVLTQEIEKLQAQRQVHEEAIRNIDIGIVMRLGAIDERKLDEEVVVDETTLEGDNQEAR